MKEKTKKRYWLIYWSLDTLDDFLLCESSGNDVTEDMVNASNPLAERMKVLAVESDKAAVLALIRAAGATQGLKPIATEVRDLFRRPLLEHELNGFDAVVLDPPRAGAEAQAKRLAASKLGTVVYASCDDGTFARDAAILIAGGYALEGVTPVDQFRYSAHIELVGVFRRPQKY